MGILANNRPKQLTWLEKEEEVTAREESSVKVVVAAIDSRSILKRLPSLIPEVLGRQINYKVVGFQSLHRNAEIVLKVEKEEEKGLLIRHAIDFNYHGISFLTYQTERERQVERWLQLRAKELKKVGVRARTFYMGIYIDGCKWVWDELEGMLIKTIEQDKKFQRKQ